MYKGIYVHTYLYATVSMIPSAPTYTTEQAGVIGFITLQQSAPSQMTLQQSKSQYVYAGLYMYMCVYPCMYLYVCVCVHNVDMILFAHMYVCPYPIYIHIYIHTYIQTCIYI